MICRSESRFAAGFALSTKTVTLSAATAAAAAQDLRDACAARSLIVSRRAGKIRRQSLSSKQARAATSVIQLRNARFPLEMRAIWKAAISAPAIRRVLRGPKTKKGAMTSTR